MEPVSGFRRSGGNLTGARGESRTVEVVLFDLIVPAVGHVFPCTQTGGMKEISGAALVPGSLS